MNLRQRVARLEGASPANTYEADAMEFDRLVAELAKDVPPDDLERHHKFWGVGRAMLRTYPGCAVMFAHTHPDDYYA